MFIFLTPPKTLYYQTVLFAILPNKKRCLSDVLIWIFLIINEDEYFLCVY